MTNIMSILILLKISKQIKMQANMHQTKRLKETLKVAIAIFIQNLVIIIFMLVLLLSVVFGFFKTLIYSWNISYLSLPESDKPCISRYEYVEITPAVDKALLICILFNSFITLFVMSGYRNAMLDFLRYLYKISLKALFKLGLYKKNVKCTPVVSYSRKSQSLTVSKL